MGASFFSFREEKYMEYCIIMCRSLTYAQRAVRLLERENVRAHLAKAPQGVTPEGCSYGVRVAKRNLDKAVGLMTDAGIRRGRIYSIDSKGRAEVVEK